MQGVYEQCCTRAKSMKLKELKKLCESEYYARPDFGIEETERQFWDTILHGNRIYGADISGTLMDADNDVRSSIIFLKYYLIYGNKIDLRYGISTNLDQYWTV